MIWQRAAGRAKLCIIAILCFVLVLQGNMVVLAQFGGIVALGVLGVIGIAYVKFHIKHSPMYF